MDVIKADEGQISTGFVPRPHQAQLFRKLKRFSVIVCHRRFGKSVFAINLLIDRALRSKLPNPQFYFIAPTYSQAKRISWQYLHTFTDNIPNMEFNEADLRCTFPHNNAKIQLLSGENYTSLKGVYSDGTVHDEFGSMNPLVWQEAVRPTLSDRAGWSLFMGTPVGANHFKELYDYGLSEQNPEWMSAMFKASETGIIPELELQSAKATMDESTYMQEYECSFSSGLVGAYFTRELEKAESEGRIGNFPYDPALPVETAWDLGISDSTTIWFFQLLRGIPTFIGYYEISGVSIKHVVKDLKDKNFVFGEHIMPHDARARDLSTGRTIEQNLFSLGIRPIRVIPRVGQKRESVNAARMLIAKARFDRKGCEQGLKCLWNYRRKWNEKTMCFDENPLHDWSSHGSDAFQQAALGIRDEMSHSRESISSRTYDGSYPLSAETDYDPFNYEVK